MLHFTNHIDEHMTKHPYFSLRNTSVSDALEVLRKKGFRHLPIVERGKVVGVVSDRTLKQAVAFSDTIHLTLGDVMVRDPYCVNSKTSLSEVIQNMTDRKIGSAIILNSDGEVVGIFTSIDAMKILASVLERSTEEKKFEPNMEQFLSGSVFL